MTSARWRRTGTRKVRRGRRFCAGVHVAFVIGQMCRRSLVALSSRRQALKTDIVGAAIIARQYQHLGVTLAFGIQRAAQSTGSGRAGLQRRLVDRNAQRTVGLWSAMAMHEGGITAMVLPGPMAVSLRGEPERVDAPLGRLRGPSAQHRVLFLAKLLESWQLPCHCDSARLRASAFAG